MPTLKKITPETLAIEAQRLQLQKLKKRGSTKRRSSAPSAHRSPTQRTGHTYELQAGHFLQNQGLHLLEYNVASRFGEIDLIAKLPHLLVFIEVRYRQHNQYGGAVYSVHPYKQLRIKRCAQWHLPRLSQQYFAGHLPFCRFDVVAIEAEHIYWIQDAFS